VPLIFPSNLFSYIQIPFFLDLEYQIIKNSLQFLNDLLDYNMLIIGFDTLHPESS